MNHFKITTEAADIRRVLLHGNPAGDLQLDVLGHDGQSEAYVASPVGSALDLERHIRDVIDYPHYLRVQAVTEDELLDAGVL